jgi:uncharacterized protein YndB with AHSA1/START domain
MKISAQQQQAVDGTVSVPKYYEGFDLIDGDIRLHGRYYTYKTGARLVSGTTLNFSFTINRPVRDVWPYLKDWNLWMNSFGYFFPGVVGDLEGKSFRITLNQPNVPSDAYPFEFKVLRVIPEHLIAIYQPVPEDGGNGGVSPGFHVTTLDERDGQTAIMFAMEHAFGTQDMTEEQALDSWRESGVTYQQMWREHFIPALRKLVCQDN